MSPLLPPSRRQQVLRLRTIAQRTLAHFPLEPVSLSLLQHAFNTTFTVVDSGGSRYVLHILRPEDEPVPEVQRVARAESELWWLDRLATDLGLAFPTDIRTRTGTGVVSLNDPEPDPPEDGHGRPTARLCTLFRWVDGRFTYRRLTPAHLEQVGRLTAALHNHSAQLNAPPTFDRPLVDRADAELEESTTRLFSDHVSPEAAQVVRRALQRAREAQDQLGAGAGAFGIIHADIHHRNYLFHNGEARLIDFGDCGWGHYLYDLAVTDMHITDLPQGPALHAALLSGYRQVRDLSPAEERLIDAFALLRHVQDLTWVLKNPGDPTFAAWAARIPSRVAEITRMLSSATPTITLSASKRPPGYTRSTSRPSPAP